MTVGEIGTISAGVGILAHYVAEHGELQKQLRAEPNLLPPAIEEILRIFGPLVANRRFTTQPVEIGGRTTGEGERITLMWMSANRDKSVFDEPEQFRLDRDQSKSLLWGAGIHACPGAPLARLELRVFVEELLSGTCETVKSQAWQKKLPRSPFIRPADTPLCHCGFDDTFLRGLEVTHKLAILSRNKATRPRRRCAFSVVNHIRLSPETPG